MTCSCSSRSSEPDFLQLCDTFYSSGFQPAYIDGYGLAGPPLEFDDPDTPGAGIGNQLRLDNGEARGPVEFKPLLGPELRLCERVQLKLKPRLVVLDPPAKARGPALAISVRREMAISRRR
jgi:hypothetical protein